jgi:hypothetical protein
MGKGLARAFKGRYPQMFRQYQELCRNGLLDIGKLWLWKGSEQWVLNFPTKKHWKDPSKLSYIQAGLEKFVEQYEQRGITEIAFPRLGCGNGGLDWNKVQPLMERYLRKLPIPVYIHDFEKDIGVPEHRESRLANEFHRSFDTFVMQIGSVIHEERGNFYTVANKTPFKVHLDSIKNLVVERGGRRHIVSNEELYELWTLLLRGPLARQKLAGKAREEAYYIFPVLAHLPYVRSIEIGRNEDDAALAVEIVKERSLEDVLPADDCESQGELEWA